MENVRLKGKLREKKITYEDCSKILNISVTAFANKINRNSFYITEVIDLSNFLGLTNEEKNKIFLE